MTQTSSHPALSRRDGDPRRPGNGSSGDGKRLEIQGLRAVAVLMVVLFHLWPGRLSGGYVGVDVFFVISGFLITSHLLRESAATGRVHLAAFWARRVRRLLPAACLVLATTGIAVALWVPRLAWTQFYKEIGASALYVENWSLAHDSVDYLAASNEPSPVQHYWTLSAEEQFYLGWPLLVLLAVGLARVFRGRARHSAPDGARTTRMMTGLAALTVAASLGYSLYETKHNPSAAYFISTTRAWEFAAGGLLACLAPAAPAAAPRFRAAVSGAALLVLLWTGLTFDASTPMPGTGAVVVVAATVALIAAGDSRVPWSPVRLLRLRPAQFIGDISYSMYLWHWPLLIVLPYVTGEKVGLLGRVGILIATIVLSAGTKRWVEDPIRRGRRFGLRRPGVALVYAALGASIIVAGCSVGYHVVRVQQDKAEKVAHQLVAKSPRCFGAESMADPAHCPPDKFGDTIVPAPTAAARDYPNFPACEDQLRRVPFDPCHFGDPPARGVPHVLLIGDSHARTMAVALMQLAADHRLTLDTAWAGGCDWATGKPPIATKAIADICLNLRKNLTPFLRTHARDYDLVVTTSYVALQKGPTAQRVTDVLNAWRPVLDQGVPVVAIRDNPTPGLAAKADPNHCLATVAAADANDKCSLSRSGNLDRWFDTYRAATKREPRSIYLDLTKYYCRGNVCPAVIGGVNVYRDNSHLTVTYAKSLAPFLFEELVRAGAIRP